MPRSHQFLIGGLATLIHLLYIWNLEHTQEPLVDKWHDKSCHQSMIGGS